MRKHGFRAIMALIMAVCLLPMTGLASEGKPAGNLFGSTLMDNMQNIDSVALAGDTLYIRTTKGLYAYKPGDERASLLMDMPDVYGYDRFITGKEGEQPLLLTTIIGDGEALYGLDPRQQKLYPLAVSGGEVRPGEAVKLDMSAFISGEEPNLYMQDPLWMLIADGRLYMKKDNWEGEPADLYSFDMATGEMRLHQVSHLQSMASYRDGNMIALRLDPQNAYDYEKDEMRKPEFVLFNPADDSVEALGVAASVNMDSGQMSAIYYDSAEDSLYLYTDTDLYRYDDGLKTERLVGYLPMYGNFWVPHTGGLLPLPDGRLAVAFGQNIFLRSRTEAGLEGTTVLALGGGLDDVSLLNRVAMEMDDVVLRRVEGAEYGYVSADTLASMFLTGNVTVDIMPMNAYSFDFDKLIGKGYLADLSGNEKISAYVNSLAPNLVGAVRRDGKIYAVPAQLIVFPVGAYVKHFNKLGLDIPKTFEELIGLVERWAGGLGAEHPDYMLFAEPDARAALRRLAFDCYVNSRFGAGEDLVFDTPEFRELMARIEAIDYGDMVQEFNYDTPEGMAAAEAYYDRTTLLETGMGYELQYMTSVNNIGDHQSVPLVLPLKEGMQGYHQADFTLLTVMSTSPHQEQAAQFIGHYIDKLDVMIKAGLNLSHTEAIPNPNYERDLALWEDNLAMLEKRYEAAEGAEKTNAAEDLAYTKKAFEEVREVMKFIAKEDDLAVTHDMISKLYVMTGLMNVQREALYSDALYSMFEEGQLTLDQFIKQADDKLRLVRLEYQ